MIEPVLARAREGDELAFTQLTAPHRRELLLHCYRILGSLHDAEDALQETLVAAWRGLDSFEGRASLRAWLYRIATNRCLNMLRDSSRRPQRSVGATLPFTPPPPTRMGEASWLEPFPDRLLEELPDRAPGPEARYETREAVGLAFVTALQRLPARQRVALVLRDVLGFPAAEAAEMLEVSEATVNSALQRARAALLQRGVPNRERAVAPGSARERELADAFADAFEAADFDRVVSLLREDAWVTMPPEPFEYQGHAAIARFFEHAGRFRAERREMRLVPTRANGQPAWAQYFRRAGERKGRLSGLLVIALDEDGIAAVTRFADTNLPAHFELPPTLEW